MIVRSKAPLRLGLAGGGTDVSPYCDLYGGVTLNATIDLYAYCTIEETSDGLVHIDAYDADCHCTLPLAENLDTSDGKAILIKGVYNRLVSDFGITPGGFCITTSNDAPCGSGLGTSSTMVVCIIKAFAEWHHLPLGDYESARLAYQIERVDLGLSGGRQDQYAAAFGGFNFMEYGPSESVIVNPLKVKRWIVDELEGSIVLYYTGRSRSSAEIIDRQKKNTASGNAASIDAMHRIRRSAYDMKSALMSGDMASFAAILGRGWEDKKLMADGITNPVIEEAFKTATDAGAISGKVSGAGGGGFIIFFTDPANKVPVETALRGLGGTVVPFNFSTGGAHGWIIE